MKAYMNYVRKSTVGFSIGSVLLDMIGAHLSISKCFSWPTITVELLNLCNQPLDAFYFKLEGYSVKTVLQKS